MGETKIEWADYTFNPWIGCTKVSPGCTNCYAEVYGNRFGVEWGPRGLRRRTSEGNWRKPLAWNEKANRESTTPRVFCASLADVFESNVQTEQWLPDLFKMIERCNGLTWLLLTKRPENVWRLIENNVSSLKRPDVWLSENPHVWIGTSVENQAAADERIPMLLRIPAARRFLSCEPLLGEVDLSKWIYTDGGKPWKMDIDWVICGGESGPDARPMHPDWARGLRDQCSAAGTKFFFKQWGEWLVSSHLMCGEHPDSGTYAWPWRGDNDQTMMIRVGKKVAGRVLDGRTWNEAPK
jgi:protein gp37